MNRLVTFGCSQTFGVGLLDFNNLNNTPSKYAWPEILAERLNLRCINSAECGSSNKRILYLIKNFVFDQNDIVAIMWSYPARSCLIKSKEIEDFRPNNKSKLSRMFYKNFFDNNDSLFNDTLYKEYARFYLNDKNIVNKHFLIDSHHNRLDFFEEKTFDDFRFYGLADDKAHMGIETHRQFSLSISGLF